MGDMADFYISQQEGYWGDNDSSDYYSEKAANRGKINYKVCRCCGEDFLIWKKVEDKWFLPKNPQKPPRFIYGEYVR